MTLRRLFFASGVALALASAPAVAQQSGDPRQAHEAVEAQLQEERETLALLRSQRDDVKVALDLIEQTSARSAALGRRFRDEFAALEGQIRRVEKRELKARVELDGALRKLAPRLAALYRVSRRGTLALLLDAEDLAGLLRRRRALEALVGADLPVLASAREALRRQERALDELDGLKLSLARRRAMLSEELERQTKLRVELTELMEILTADAALASRVVGQLTRQERSLANLVDQLENVPETGFGALKGFLPSPAPGSFLESNFGRMVNPRSNTLTFKKGIDLRAPHGTPVRAVADGTVVYAGPYRRYGNLLVIDHGEGFHSVMAHLSAFQRKVGEPVQEGEAIGRVGDTGSDKGAYLYFELRQNGFAVDPVQWFGQEVR